MIGLSTLQKRALELKKLPPSPTGFAPLDDLLKSKQEVFDSVVEKIGTLESRREDLLDQARKLDMRGILAAKRKLEADALDMAAELLKTEAGRFVVPGEIKAAARAWFAEEIGNLSSQRAARIEVLDDSLYELNGGRPPIHSVRQKALMNDKELQKLGTLESAYRDRIAELEQEAPVKKQRAEAVTLIHQMIRQELSN